MSHVTIEQVRERLTYLEDLNARGVGSKVSSQQFEITCLRKLLASLEAEKCAEPVAFINGAWTLVYYRPPKELGLKIGDKLFTAPPAPANAEPVAWLWSHRKHPSEVTLVRPEDDEKAEPGLWSGWSCQALYANPPAPVSVPDALYQFAEFMAAESIKSGDYPDGWQCKASNAAHEYAQSCRAAMLQGAGGNSPVIPDQVLSAVRKVARIRADFDDFDGDRRGIGDCLDEAEQDLILTINKYASVIAAAPQQEVKP